MRQVIFLFMAFLLTTGIANAQAVIHTEKATHDYGEIKEADGKVEHSFEIENKGDQPLVITRVIPSCGCTTPDWTKEPIAPGKTGSIKITFDPAHRPGPFTKTISVYSNGKTGSFILTIRGDVK
ncbi:DUF1573 domain-containing protein [Parabacteroides sp. OttesenSCG-928-G06]|nr:DUF1573 domain-containing protein [Parabacteroides sp. OttesenSCG-928-G06]